MSRLDFLLNTAPPRKSTLLVKILDLDPEKKNLLYISKWIINKFKILGSSEKIFATQVDF